MGRRWALLIEQLIEIFCNPLKFRFRTVIRSKWFSRIQPIFREFNPDLSRALRTWKFEWITNESRPKLISVVRNDLKHCYKYCYKQHHPPIGLESKLQMPSSRCYSSFFDEFKWFSLWGEHLTSESSQRELLLRALQSLHGKLSSVNFTEWFE